MLMFSRQKPFGAPIDFHKKLSGVLNIDGFLCLVVTVFSWQVCLRTIPFKNPIGQGKAENEEKVTQYMYHTCPWP